MTRPLETETKYACIDLLDTEIELLITYEVHSYGQLPSGMRGPPEDYDPGAPPEVEIISAISVETGLNLTFLLTQITGLRQAKLWKRLGAREIRVLPRVTIHDELLEDIVENLDLPPPTNARRRSYDYA